MNGPLQAPGASYRVLPLRFLRHRGRVLVTNLVGEHLWLDPDDFARFTGHALSPDEPVFADLEARQLLEHEGTRGARGRLATKLRTRASWLRGGPSLHLFVVTLRCNQSCPYCQVSRAPDTAGAQFDMTPEVADRAVDLMFSSPSRALTVEFQGGEPTLRLDLVERIVERVERRNADARRNVTFVLASNGTRLADETVTFMSEHGVVLSTSLDGPADVHDANRPFHGRRASSHAAAVEAIGRASAVLGEGRVSALMTTTAHSLGRARDIVAEYVQLGLHEIFLRNLTPLGFAVRTGWSARYGTDDFLAFYREALAEIVEVNRRGHRLVEVYAQNLLRRMLTPFATSYMDLQAPYAGGLGCLVYDYDGSVYPSDEARMLAASGDDALRLGSVDDDWHALVTGPVSTSLAASSCHETLPGCATCALAPWCGADPVYHWATQGDPLGHRPTSGFCRKNTGIILHLLDLLESPDPFVRKLLTSWATAPECDG